MAEIMLTGNALHKAEMEYHDKFVKTLGRIQHITLMSRIDVFNTACHLPTQTVAHILPSFQGINQCIQYLVSDPHKPIFYLYNYYDCANVISGN